MTFLELYGYPRPVDEADKDECLEAISHYLDMSQPEIAIAYTQRLKEILQFNAKVLSCGKAGKELHQQDSPENQAHPV